LKGAARAKDMMGVVVSQRGIMRRVENVESQITRLVPLADVLPALLKALNVPQPTNLEGSPSSTKAWSGYAAPTALPPGCVPVKEENGFMLDGG